jgi:type II secretory pathway pseudopilin PulG
MFFHLRLGLSARLLLFLIPLIAIPLAVILDFLIIRRVWRAVNHPVIIPASPVHKPDHFWRWFAVVVLAMVSIPILISIVGLLAAIAIPNFVKARQQAQENARQAAHISAGQNVAGDVATNFYIGQAYFPNGDSIEITSVQQNETQMIVKGRYHLVSQDYAQLALNITSTNKPTAPDDASHQMRIAKGDGDFELIHFHLAPGLPHVSMYADGHAFASLYFGTKAEAQKESEAKWITNAVSASVKPRSPTSGIETLTRQPPVVVETFPVSGALNVEPGETELRVRFSKEMADGSWSWSSAWENSAPEFIGQPHYEADHKTCVVKVKLEPGGSYAFWLNSDKFPNFKDREGRPSVPYLLIFQTKPN